MVPLAPIPIEIHTWDIVVAALGAAKLPVVMRTRAEQRRELPLLTWSLPLRCLGIILLAVTLTGLVFQFQLRRLLLVLLRRGLPRIVPALLGHGQLRFLFRLHLHVWLLFLLLLRFLLLWLRVGYRSRLGVIVLRSGGIRRGGGIRVVTMGMGSGRSRVALLVAVRDGAGLPVSVPAAAGGGAIVGGGWRCGNFGCEGGALGRDLLGGGSRGDGGPDDGEGEAKRDGDADLGAEAQRRAAAPAAQEPGRGAAGRTAGHRHAAAGSGPVGWWGEAVGASGWRGLWRRSRGGGEKRRSRAWQRQLGAGLRSRSSRLMFAVTGTALCSLFCHRPFFKTTQAFQTPVFFFVSSVF